MSFYQTLVSATADSRAYLLSAPVIGAAQRGEVSLPRYIAFLTQAYHHVKHTVPLLMACGSRLSGEYEWVREGLAEYIEEELGHHQWILNDIEACGGDKAQVSGGQPGFAIEMMVAFLYDQIQRQNPMGFFGMVLVLEGVSVEMATPMADMLREKLRLPEQAFSYLYSHGSLDQGHIKFFESLMNRVTQFDDQQAIIHAANRVYRLYGDMYRELEQVN